MNLIIVYYALGHYYASGHLITLEFSNGRRVLSHCNTRLKLLYLLIIITCPSNMVSVIVNFFARGRFYFHFSLVFHNFEGFLIKQLFHLCLLDNIWDDYSQLGATCLIGYLSSHIQCALVELLLIILQIMMQRLTFK